MDQEVHTDHFQCTGNNDNVKPSLGLLNQYCVCYKPNDESVTSITMDIDDYDANLPVINSINNEEEEDTEDQNQELETSNIVYLGQEDFLYGTYRITQPGTYIFTEDVEFNFNAPSDEDRESESFSPNSYEDLWWFPKVDGSQEDEYEGGSTWSGPYQLGFFTGLVHKQNIYNIFFC